MQSAKAGSTYTIGVLFPRAFGKASMRLGVKSCNIEAQSKTVFFYRAALHPNLPVLIEHASIITLFWIRIRIPASRSRRDGKNTTIETGSYGLPVPL